VDKWGEGEGNTMDVVARLAGGEGDEDEASRGARGVVISGGGGQSRGEVVDALLTVLRSSRDIR
jgi:hypothetical protein